MSEKIIVGIDIGTITIGIVLLDSNGSVFFRDYQFHNGNVYSKLEDMIRKFPVQTVASIGVVGEKSSEYFKTGIEVNEQVAIIEGVKQFVPKPGSIISIGGETFCLILFNRDGQYQKYISNSACAAGTGSFLDQQAIRLGLSGSAELSRLAQDYHGIPPKIATRCAVFAKTDLVHMQQQGFSLPAIAAGLCHGVALNITNTLFHGIKLHNPIVVIGGVSKNQKIIQFLENEIHHSLQAPPDREYQGAIGAATIALRQISHSHQNPPIALDNLLNKTPLTKSYFYASLFDAKSKTPDFSAWHSFVRNDVEVDIYETLSKDTVIDCYLGIDIGSTSTKAIVMNCQKDVIAGCYTRTGGQPITALQKITRTIEYLEKRFAVTFSLHATGTTGSGRKFIQKVSHAEYAVDEITAHAFAAYHLDPEIDTIIEIGGQDAKFTVMHNGTVTFSVMNYVCAAGTGSFIEEQARQLGIPLKDYANIAEKHAAPLISDRCTVFMQRDLHHLLSRGYSGEELLATALHSVRDNYLSKVAHTNKIGRHIAFQGATAKNHALVRAFEKKLEQPIYVSKFCHLTGALGVCLKMMEISFVEKSRFMKNLHNEQIFVGEYVCEFCNNNCKIKTIEIDGQSQGWGYLCGRDEMDSAYRKKKKSGFDLLKDHRKVFDVSEEIVHPKPRSIVNMFQEFQQNGPQTVVPRPGFSIARIRNRIQFNMLALHREVFSFKAQPRQKNTGQTPTLKIGLPATLTMFEYFPLWELFFKRLGFTTIVSPPRKNSFTTGSEIGGTDFCAPLTDFLGHITQIAPKVDYIFFPQFFENSSEKEEKSYCYYCHYAVPIIQNIPGVDLSKKLINPVLNLNKNIDDAARAIYLHLPDILKAETTFAKVEQAFFLAWDWFQKRKADLQYLYRDQVGATNDIGIVLLGRPYLILHDLRNKGIPEKLAAMGIQSFYMDMVPINEKNLKAARDFIKLNHWHYGDQIIKVAETVAQTERLFPVFITAFKCAPDSFIIGYFKDIMDYYQKPYLILQFDEHEAAEGYDTRLEAAVETFRNFTGTKKKRHLPSIPIKKNFEDKTYLLPSHDLLCAQLIQGALKHAGFNALIIEQTPETIYRSLRINDGQCLPVSVLAQGILHTVLSHNLNPNNVAFLLNSEAELACNLPQYPVMIKQLLEKMGKGMDKVDVMVTNFIPTDLPIEIMYGISMSYIMAGLVQKIVQKIRPREKIQGLTDKCLQRTTTKLVECFKTGTSKESIFKEVVNDFLKIEQRKGYFPKVAIIGDLFVRDNDNFNQNLIGHIEKSDAEVITVPFIDSLKLLAEIYFKNQWLDGRYINLLKDKMVYKMANIFNRKLEAIAKPILYDRLCEPKHGSLDYLQKHFLTTKHSGETVENLLKVYYLKNNYPDLKLFVNVNPIFCCPGLISETIYKKVEKEIGIPIISITYDGTQTDKNRILNPYLYFMK
jgi:predicted CoA-substrate-specific enzyme activase